MEVTVKLKIDKGVFDNFTTEEDLVKYLKKTKTLEIVDVFPAILSADTPEIETLQDIFDFLEDNGIQTDNHKEGEG